MPIPYRKQIKNPYVLHKKNAAGPYAQKIGARAHGKGFGEQSGEVVGCQLCEGDILASARDLSNWLTVGSSLGRTITACDGVELTNNGLIPGVEEGNKFLYKSVSLQDNLTYRAYAHIKKGDGSDWVMLYLSANSGANGSVYFNVATGTIGSVLGLAQNPAIRSVVDGWYEISLEINSGSGVVPPQVRIYAADGDGDITVVGDAFVVWHYSDLISVCQV